MIESVTDADFAEKVLGSKKPVLVEYWAPWCGPCRQLAPVLAQIADEHADALDVVKLNSDDNPMIAMTNGVMGVPTVQLFVDGKMQLSLTGARPKSKLLNELGKVLDLQRV